MPGLSWRRGAHGGGCSVWREPAPGGWAGGRPSTLLLLPCLVGAAGTSAGALGPGLPVVCLPGCLPSLARAAGHAGRAGGLLAYSSAVHSMTSRRPLFFRVSLRIGIPITGGPGHGGAGAAGPRRRRPGAGRPTVGNLQDIGEATRPCACLRRLTCSGCC